MTDRSNTPDVSLAQSGESTCPQCGRAILADIWLIVDVAARPDLAAAIRAGGLHTVVCPACGPQGAVDAPLLLYFADYNPAIGQPQLIFSPAQQTSAEEDQDQASSLLSELVQRLGVETQHGWIDGITVLQRNELAGLLDEALGSVFRSIGRDSVQGNRDNDGEAEIAKHKLPPAASSPLGSILAMIVPEGEVPQEIMAELESIFLAFSEDGLRIDSLSALEVALAERPELLDKLQDTLEAALRQAGLTDEDFDRFDNASIADVEADSAFFNLLNDFLAAKTWDESQVLVECHPELLSIIADECLAQAIENYASNPDTVAMLSTHRRLLCRCREVGVACAFAEKILNAEGLAEANRLGLAPEEYLARTRAAQHMSSLLQDVLAELAAEGVEAHTPAKLERALTMKSELLAWLVVTEAHGSATSHEFVNDLLAVHEGKLRYRRTGDLQALDSSLEAWLRIMNTQGFDSVHARFRFVVLDGAGKEFLQRYWTSGRNEDIDHALDLLERAMCLAPTVISDWLALLNDLASGLHSRYMQTWHPESLDAAIRILEHVIRLVPSDHYGKAFTLNNLSNVLQDRYHHAGHLEDLQEAIEVSRQAVSLAFPQSPTMASCLISLGNLLSDYYAHTGTIDVLGEAVRVYYGGLELTPPDSPRLASRLNNLSGSLLDLYAQLRQPEDLEEALRLAQESVRLTSFDSPDRQSCLNNLGVGLLHRYQNEGSLEDLDEAIRTLQEAVNPISSGHPRLPGYLSNLGQALQLRYVKLGHREALDQAIDAYQQAARLTQSGSHYWILCLGNLGALLRNRYEVSGSLGDLDEAIDYLRQAVDIAPPDSPNRFSCIANLIVCLGNRLTQTDQLEDLDELIGIQREVVDRAPPDSPDRYLILTTQGSRLYERYNRSEKVEDLEEAILVLREATTMISQETTDGVAILDKLGIALRERYRLGGQVADLDEAIDRYRGVINNLIESASPRMYVYLDKLGASLRDRYEALGRSEDLNEAAHCCQEAITLAPQDALSRTSCLVNWGACLRSRYSQSGRVEDLEETIRVYREAMDLVLPGSSDQALVLNNLGVSLRNRYLLTRRLQDIDEAILCLQDAVRLTPAHSHDLPRNLHNLANALMGRYQEVGRAKDREGAISAWHQAASSIPVHFPNRERYLIGLGSALLSRYHETRRIEDLNDAIGIYQQTINQAPSDWPDHSISYFALGVCLQHKYAQTGCLEQLEGATRFYRLACKLGELRRPQDALNAASDWGRWAMERAAWADAAEAFTTALKVGHLLRRRQVRRSDKEYWLVEMKGIAPAAAYAQVRLGNSVDAAVAMENGRSMLLAEAIEQSRRDLDRLPTLGHAVLHARYQAALAERRRLEHPDAVIPGSRLAAIEANETEFDAVITAIRGVAGYADFFAEPTFARIQAAAQEVPLLYIAATAAGGLALVVHPGGVEPVWLDGLTEAALRTAIFGPNDDPALGGYLGAYDRWRSDRTHDPAIHAAWHRALDDTTAWLWDVVMAPVVEHLVQAGVSEAVLIPGGLVGLLPLHAAWTPDASRPTGRCYALDSVTFRYVPSATALAASQERTRRLAADGILAVDNPDGSLAFSRQEVTAALSHFAPEHRLHLAGPSATLDAVQSAVAGAPVLHFSTHGWAGWTEPLQGGLLLADDAELTLAALLDMKLPDARLAVLSACETGVPGTKVPDEVIGLPAGLLQAGVAGVAASLWAVNDLSTARLMERFYQAWLDEGLTPAAALCRAQRWLRDVTRQELGDYYASFIGRMADDEARHARAAIRWGGEPGERPYSHPYYWAAFTFTGA